MTSLFAMRRFRGLYFWIVALGWMLAAVWARAQEAPTPSDFPLVLADRPQPGGPTITQFVHDRSSRVLILCYHRFAKKKEDALSTTDKDLRAQLQKVRATGFEFISMDQFLAWRRGEANIPALSALITVDDGFLSTYTVADPIFREFKVPYVLFAYTGYIENGSAALTWDQVRKMVKNGVTVASHSATHQHMAGLKTPKAAEASANPEADRHKYAKAYGSDVKSAKTLLTRLSLGLSGELAGAPALAGNARWSQVGLARDPYEAWVWDELYGSRERFHKELGYWMPTFAYPYGSFSDRVAEMGRLAGYDALFTVNPEEVNFTTPIDRVDRFVIYSDHPENFDKALVFRVVGATPEGDPAELPAGVTVSPARHSPAPSRRPEIIANLKTWLATGMDPATLTLRLSGFGNAPFQLDPASGDLRISVPAQLRGKSHTVALEATNAKGEKQRIRWSFLLPPFSNSTASP